MNHRRSTFVLLLAVALFGTSTPARDDADALGIVPIPASVERAEGSFTIPARWSIFAPGRSERDAAAFFVSYVRHGETRFVSSDDAADIRMHLMTYADVPPEGYRLRVDRSGITIDASSAAGLFYGVQTLEQMIDAASGTLPAVAIEDEPRFAWRGMHLDVSRHFFGVATVKRYIDVAAHFKFNTFHWHLTDDQGWRLQIRRYPRLTGTGSCRAQTEVGNDATEFDGRRYCGFYTQAQVREVVRYAAARHVTIVPEIEMPGHADASVAAYPQLACGSPRVAVRTTWGVSHELICPTEASFAFLDDVLREVTGLFPGPYVHVGGDEAPKDTWAHSPFVRSLMKTHRIETYDAVQGYFDRRIEAILHKYHRKMVGWDEILDGGVTRTATVMSWRGDSGAIRAARRGNDVVMSPDGPLYFDAYQGDPNDEPLAIDNFTRLQDVYAFSAIPAGLNGRAASHVIGVQGNAWTEYIPTESQLFYMTLPRELALAEVAWSPESRRNWPSFERRSSDQYRWLMRNGINFRIPNPAFTVSGSSVAAFDNVSASVRTVALRVDEAVYVTLTAPVRNASIHYTLDGTTPTLASPTYSAPLHLAPGRDQPVVLTAVTILSTGRASTPSELLLEGGSIIRSGTIPPRSIDR